MLIRKIKKIITQSGTVILYNRLGEQWIGTNSSIYAISGLPDLKLEHLPQLLDIPQDKFADLGTVEERPLDDYLLALLKAASEESNALTFMSMVDAELSIFGKEMVMLRDEQNIVFLTKTELQPINFTAQTRFLCGRAYNENWIIVMEGLFAVALLRCKKLNGQATMLLNEIAAAATSSME